MRGDLERVEKAIGLESVASVETVTTIGHYLQQSGGKRLRPALLLLCARSRAAAARRAIQLGAVVEMFHAATLVHDDVIDVAQTRRGRPSANVQWGNHTCVLAGDWLYMQAFQIALRERNFHILDLLIGLTQMMVEGELMQLERIGKHRDLGSRLHGTGGSQNRMPVLGLRQAGRGVGGSRHGDRGEARRVRLESRDGIPTGRRYAGFHVAGERRWASRSEEI